MLNEVLKWAKDKVLSDLSSRRIVSKADGMRVVEFAHVCGEGYLSEKCVDCNTRGADGLEANCSDLSLPFNLTQRKSRTIMGHLACCLNSCPESAPHIPV